MNIFSIQSMVEKLKPLGEEISVDESIQGMGYKGGLIRFNIGTSDRKQISHEDEDVIAFVLQGEGVLRFGNEIEQLAPEHICRIPARTPHDFSAAGEQPLLLFYLMIQTGSVL